jgi:hypothetical protein
MREVAVGVALVPSLLAIGIGAAMAAGGGSALLGVFEICCLVAVGLVAILELLYEALGLRARSAAVRRFRRELDELPETPHPLDQVARPR